VPSLSGTAEPVVRFGEGRDSGPTGGEIRKGFDKGSSPSRGCVVEEKLLERKGELAMVNGC
jgi:hypothetical protein